jgi:hypothetical protein
MVFKLFRASGSRFLGPVLLALALAAPACATLSFLGGLEDFPGTTTIEKNGDYNDLMFRMTGDLTVVAPGASLFALTPNLVTESGEIYWDNRSIDGPDYNFGFCALGTGNCHIPGLSNEQFSYLALPGGGAPLNVLFQASGAVTLELLLEVSAGAQTNTLGWYDPAHPETLHQIFSGPDSAGASVTFTPSSTFALYSTNLFGDIYSSVAAANVMESPTHQHFALLQDLGAEVPEPGTWSLIAISIVGLAGKRAYAMLKTRCG